MTRKLVLAMHWTDDPEHAIADVAEACKSLKAVGTNGYAVLYDEDDESAVKFYEGIRDLSESDA